MEYPWGLSVAPFKGWNEPGAWNDAEAVKDKTQAMYLHMVFLTEYIQRLETQLSKKLSKTEYTKDRRNDDGLRDVWLEDLAKAREDASNLVEDAVDKVKKDVDTLRQAQRGTERKVASVMKSGGGGGGHGEGSLEILRKKVREDTEQSMESMLEKRVGLYVEGKIDRALKRMNIKPGSTAIIMQAPAGTATTNVTASGQPLTAEQAAELAQYNAAMGTGGSASPVSNASAFSSVGVAGSNISSPSDMLADKAVGWKQRRARRTAASQRGVQSWRIEEFWKSMSNPDMEMAEPTEAEIEMLTRAREVEDGLSSLGANTDDLEPEDEVLMQLGDNVQTVLKKQAAQAIEFRQFREMLAKERRKDHSEVTLKMVKLEEEVGAKATDAVEKVNHLEEVVKHMDNSALVQKLGKEIKDAKTKLNAQLLEVDVKMGTRLDKAEAALNNHTNILAEQQETVANLSDRLKSDVDKMLLDTNRRISQVETKSGDLKRAIEELQVVHTHIQEVKDNVYRVEQNTKSGIRDVLGIVDNQNSSLKRIETIPEQVDEMLEVQAAKAQEDVKAALAVSEEGVKAAIAALTLQVKQQGDLVREIDYKLDDEITERRTAGISAELELLRSLEEEIQKENKSREAAFADVMRILLPFRRSVFQELAQKASWRDVQKMVEPVLTDYASEDARLAMQRGQGLDTPGHWTPDAGRWTRCLSCDAVTSLFAAPNTTSTPSSPSRPSSAKPQQNKQGQQQHRPSSAASPRKTHSALTHSALTTRPAHPVARKPAPPRPGSAGRQQQQLKARSSTNANNADTNKESAGSGPTVDGILQQARTAQHQQQQQQQQHRVSILSPQSGRAPAPENDSHNGNNNNKIAVSLPPVKAEAMPLHDDTENAPIGK